MLSSQDGTAQEECDSTLSYTRERVIYLTVGDRCNFLVNQQIQRYDLCQQPHHLVQICLAERFLGGANITSLSSLGFSCSV